MAELATLILSSQFPTLNKSPLITPCPNEVNCIYFRRPSQIPHLALQGPPSPLPQVPAFSFTQTLGSPPHSSLTDLVLNQSFILCTEAQRNTLFPLNWATSHPPKMCSGRRSNRRKEKATPRSAHSKKASWRKWTISDMQPFIGKQCNITITVFTIPHPSEKPYARGCPVRPS